MNIFYDLSYFLKPELSDKAEEAAERIKSEIKKINGVIIEENLPSRKILGYPIAKRTEGLFGVMKLSVAPESVNSLGLGLKKNADILRFLISKEIYKETAPVRKKKPSLLAKKEKITKQDKIDKDKVVEIDKKLDEILGI